MKITGNLLSVIYRMLILLSVTGCTSVSIPYLKENKPVEKGYDIPIKLENVSEDEYTFVINAINEKHKYILVSNKFSGNTAEITYNVDSVSDIGNLTYDLQMVSASYDGSKTPVRVLQVKRTFNQYMLVRYIGAKTEGGYSITVTFDPNTELILGGYPMIADENGCAVFNGTGLILDEAKQGIIYITDSVGNRVKVEKMENGKWMVSVKGISLGKEAVSDIELEVLR